MRERVRTAAMTGVLAGALTLGTFAQTDAPRTLELSFPSEGLVTLVASNVALHDILAEWTRQTGAVFTNADKLTTTPITVQYERLPEVTVIDSLLRSAAGYLVAPRDPGRVAASRIASVFIVPSSSGTSSGSYPTSASAPIAAELVTPGSPNDEIPPANPNIQDAPAQTPPAGAGRPNSPGTIVPIVPIVPVVGTGRGGGGRGGSPPPPPPTGRGTGS